jgi:DNA (cytosine-5)-methyltransferase 1
MEQALLADVRNSSQESQKTFCEFFAGIGLVGEGLLATGWRCIYANDFSREKQEMYERRNGDSPQYHLCDVKDTAAVVSRIPESPVLATASFPCIDLSLAGHYRGFDGEHSSTFFAFADVLRALGKRRPRIVMLENVVGFLSARRGQDFDSAATALSELGYWLDAFVLDAKHFVPQSRPRVFVIGVDAPTRRRLKRATLFDDAPPSLLESSLRPARLISLIKSVELPTGWLGLELPAPRKRRAGLAAVVDVDDEQEWWDDAEVARHYKMMSDLHRARIDALLEARSQWVGTIFRRIRHEKQRAEVRFDGLAGCLRTPKGGSAKQIVVCTDAGRLRMRWMSPREYARLQGAGDFPLDGRRNQLLKGFADAVCVPAIRWIDRNILTPIYDAAVQASASNHAG